MKTFFLTTIACRALTSAVTAQSTISTTVTMEIEVTAGGQRDACVPAAE